MAPGTYPQGFLPLVELEYGGSTNYIASSRALRVTLTKQTLDLLLLVLDSAGNVLPTDDLRPAEPIKEKLRHLTNKTLLGENRG